MNVKAISLILLTFLLVSCDRDKTKEDLSRSESKEKVTEGVDVSKDPFAAFKKITEIGSKYEEIQAGVADKEPVDPVSFRDLITLLPSPPSGWKVGEPDGQTTSFSGYKISQASQTYTKGDRRIKLSIVDWAYNTGLYAPFLLSAEFSQESTRGYNKGIKIGDIPGREEYDLRSKDGSLSLLFEQRFFTQIEGENIESKELQEWWKKIDQKNMKKLVE